MELSKAVGNAHFVGSVEGDFALLGKSAFVDIVEKLENIPVSEYVFHYFEQQCISESESE